jgi:hypothetical protein
MPLMTNNYDESIVDDKWYEEEIAVGGNKEYS